MDSLIISQPSLLPFPSLQVYYYNTVSEASSWTKPDGFKDAASEVEAEPVPEKSVKVANTAWSEVTCTDGRVYFLNDESEVSLRGCYFFIIRNHSATLWVECFLDRGGFLQETS